MFKNPVFALILGLLLQANIVDIALAEANRRGLPWYQIELIAFSRTPTAAENTEEWPEDPGLPSAFEARRLSRSSAGTGSGPAAYGRLPASEFKLSREYGGLRATRGRLKPLLHLAWRQPVERGQKAGKVYLTTGAKRTTGDRYPGASTSLVETPPALEGTIRISVSRYLHVDLDLLLSRLTPQSSTTNSDQAAETPGYYGPTYRFFRMQAHRRMRSGELHYIDHPWLGVLLLISPYQLPAAPSTEQPSTPDPGQPGPAETGN